MITTIFKKQANILEKFRITAHLRKYVIDPEIINDRLIQAAISKLKVLPYTDSDPSERVTRKLVIEAYRQGSITDEKLTEDGLILLRHEKFRRHRLTDQWLQQCNSSINRLV